MCCAVLNLAHAQTTKPAPQFKPLNLKQDEFSESKAKAGLTLGSACPQKLKLPSLVRVPESTLQPSRREWLPTLVQNKVSLRLCSGAAKASANEPIPGLEKAAPVLRSPSD